MNLRWNSTCGGKANRKWSQIWGRDYERVERGCTGVGYWRWLVPGERSDVAPTLFELESLILTLFYLLFSKVLTALDNLSLEVWEDVEQHSKWQHWEDVRVYILEVWKCFDNCAGALRSLKPWFLMWIVTHSEVVAPVHSCLSGKWEMVREWHTPHNTPKIAFIRKCQIMPDANAHSWHEPSQREEAGQDGEKF